MSNQLEHQSYQRLLFANNNFSLISLPISWDDGKQSIIFTSTAFMTTPYAVPSALRLLRQLQLSAPHRKSFSSVRRLRQQHLEHNDPPARRTEYDYREPTYAARRNCMFHPSEHRVDSKILLNRRPGSCSTPDALYPKSSHRYHIPSASFRISGQCICRVGKSA